MTSNTNITAPRTLPVGWLLNALHRRELSIDKANLALGLEENSIQANQEALPLESYLRLFEWAAHELNDPLLGAHVAVESSPGEYGILGHLVSNGTTLREGFEFWERYHGIFSPDFAYHFSDNGETAWCIYSEAALPGTVSRQDILLSMGMVLKTIREYMSTEWQPLHCYFTFPEPNDIAPFQAYFGEHLRFDHPSNKFEFEAQLLDAPTTNADSSLLPILLHQANQLLDKMGNERDLVEKVRLLILTSLGTQTISTARAAERLNMSVRSLHRHLVGHNTSFKQLREEVIIKVAKEALLDTDFSITEIASRLSYSETSAFDRLFKRLTSITPRQYRQKGRASEISL